MITYEYRIPKDINSFRRSVGWYELSERQLAAAKNNSVFAITALDGEKEVGSARVVGDGGYQFFISDVIVRPEYQGMGIGREMLNRLMNCALSVADDGETIMINLMSAKDKEGFYEKLGFMRRPNDERGCGMTLFLTK
ncbi:MAG: GNAT family N-acetyltransferase [Ruminiclostridium sp.]|mgnify:CR=1 FL=1|jgi:GNAT superfamily N-acetyltransferase|nr:GNAT family N-acetyltransferase [Ruminiclostridium sp.]